MKNELVRFSCAYVYAYVDPVFTCLHMWLCLCLCLCLCASENQAGYLSLLFNVKSAEVRILTTEAMSFKENDLVIWMTYTYQWREWMSAIVYCGYFYRKHASFAEFVAVMRINASLFKSPLIYWMPPLGSWNCLNAKYPDLLHVSSTIIYTCGFL